MIQIKLTNKGFEIMRILPGPLPENLCYVKYPTGNRWQNFQQLPVNLSLKSLMKGGGE